MVKYEWSGIVVEEKLNTSKEKFERLLIFLARIKARIKYMNADIRRPEYEYVTGIAAPSSVIKKEDMEKAASELRKHRGMIYRQMKRRKP